MGFKVNFSETSVRDFSDPVPSGWYHVKVTDGEVRESGPTAKNPGAEYINWEFTIQDGENEGRKGWTNASLLPHALFTLKSVLGACGLDVDGDMEFRIHESDPGEGVAVVGKDLMAKATTVSKKDKEGKVVEGEYQNEWRSFKAFTGEASAVASSDTPLP
jgi:hypothetical protein